MVERTTPRQTALRWLLLVTNLPGTNKTLRMRIWRALKAAGAGALRDGVYVLPQKEAAQRVFAAQAAEIQAGAGSTHIFSLQSTSTEQNVTLTALFDRTCEYQELNARLQAYRRESAAVGELDARRRLGALTRDVRALEAIDFFPGKARSQMISGLAYAEHAFNARFSPNEPRAAHRKIARLDRKDYQGRIWATREHLWVDRVCSAWLIRRFIDRKAKFVWLKRIRDCPKRAVGFDFDGAEFSHVDSKVTFEVLLESFDLEADSGLLKLGSLVHFLDVGGIPVAEAPGLAAIVSGARTIHAGDDALLVSVTSALDSLYQAYAVEQA